MKSFTIILIILTTLFLIGDAKAQISGSKKNITVNNTERVQTQIKGNHVSQTNPSLTITVPSNQWCEVYLSFTGAASAGLRGLWAQITYSSTVAHTFGGLSSTTSPFEFSFNSPPIKLDTGSYTFDKAGACAASSCSLYYHGFCYSK